VMGLVSEVEQEIIKLLSDDDHMVRTAAAKALADCKSVPSWEALRDAMLDRSFVVQEAAVRSLELISRSLQGASNGGAMVEEALFEEADVTVS
jgi:HEAT repeat protein